MFTESQLCFARNFFFSEVFMSPANIRFEMLEKIKKKTEEDLVNLLKTTGGNPPPFSQSRYDFVMSEAKRISKDPCNMQKILKKTRFCTNKNCNDSDTCSFAHTLEEYNTPTCLQQEFCLDYSCKKNHGFTKEEYIYYYEIKVPEKNNINLDKTQFCGFVKNHTPCTVIDCKFAHSLWEFRPLECKYKCKGETCILFHPKTDSLFSYFEKQNIKIKPWMLRSTEMNNFEEIERRKSFYHKEVIEFFEEFKRQELLGWPGDAEERVFRELAKMNINDEDDEDDDYDEDRLIVFTTREQSESYYLMNMEVF
jgi:hypothetical protein